jgi:hypothetical protein
MMPRIGLLLLIVLSVSGRSYAQSGIGIEANIAVGRVLKHTTKFRAPVPEMSSSCELALLHQTIGKKDWEQRRHYPIWGIGATLTHYGIDSIYGNAIGLYPFLQIPLIRSKSFEWTFRGGMGIGYVTRHFERAPTWDTLNNAISSRINNYTLFITQLHYRFNNKWSVQLGASFSHLSNGAIKQPNLGVNMYGAQLGIRYWPDGDHPKKIIKDRPVLPNRILVQARLAMAFNEAGITDGPIYPVYMASLYASKRYRSKNKVYIGLDYSYHTRIYAFQRNNEINVGKEAANSWKSAVFVGHEWLFGRMALLMQIGVYIKEAAFRFDPYYEKIGYNYYLIRSEQGVLKELCLSTLLKTHKADAELVEFGIGFGF